MSETAKALIHKPVAVYSATLLYSVGGNRIAKFGEITAGSYSHDINRANVRRAADCWNACLSIDDPAAAIEAARKALKDNMTDPNAEIPDTRPWSALVRHLASLMEDKAMLSHMAKESSTSGAVWAKLLYAKADQLDDALNLLGDVK